jgi:polyphenol oxidase
MIIIESELLRKYPEVTFGFSTKIGSGDPPYFFNLSYSVGDSEEVVKRNRAAFFDSLNLTKYAFQKQVHGNEIIYVDKEGFAGESDALITDRPGLGLMISAADCTSIYIYDFKKKIIAGIHAGWRGTQKNILEKTLVSLTDNYGCSPSTMAAYIAPSISQSKYEVDEDVAKQFDEKYFKSSGSKYLLDVAGKNYDALLNYGVPSEQVQYSRLCTYTLKNLLHSYRRDGIKSGRSVGVIAMKEKV